MSLIETIPGEEAENKRTRAEVLVHESYAGAVERWGKKKNAAE